MRNRVMILLLVLVMASVALQAQQSGSESSLTETQKRGQFLFRQRCYVCHVPIATGPSSETYGPRLTKQNVAAGEGAVRKQIKEGGERMPGFQYALQPSDIDAIVQYLKTVEKPVDSVDYSR